MIDHSLTCSSGRACWPRSSCCSSAACFASSQRSQREPPQPKKARKTQKSKSMAMRRKLMNRGEIEPTIAILEAKNEANRKVKILLAAEEPRIKEYTWRGVESCTGYAEVPGL